MKKVLLLSALLTLTAQLAVAAGGEARREQRTVKTENRVVMVVGDCRGGLQTGFDPKDTYYSYELTLTVCREYKTFQADVTGRFWNTKVAPVAGTETLSYKLEQDTETFGSLFASPASDAMAGINTLLECQRARDHMSELARAQKGTSKCQ